MRNNKDVNIDGGNGMDGRWIWNIKVIETTGLDENWIREGWMQGKIKMTWNFEIRSHSNGGTLHTDRKCRRRNRFGNRKGGAHGAGMRCL